MQELQRPLTTRCGRGITGERWKSAQGEVSEFPSPVKANTRFGKLTVISDVGRMAKFPSGKTRHFLLTQCDCGAVAWKNIDNLRKQTAGCRKCGHPRRAPKWLVNRCEAAKLRCENISDPRYWDYGGRGITFGFNGPTEMACYIMQHFPLDRKMQIDRIDNRLGYEPGNIRMVTPSVNMMNRRRQIKIKMFRFRMLHPEIRYADATLNHLIGRGLTDAEIVKRFYKPSTKPKGRYGTFSTPDPDIVSQLMVY